MRLILLFISLLAFTVGAFALEPGDHINPHLNAKVYGAWSPIDIGLAEDFNTGFGDALNQEPFTLARVLHSKDGQMAISAQLDGVPLGLFAVFGARRLLTVLLPDDLHHSRLRFGPGHILQVYYPATDGQYKRQSLTIEPTQYTTAPNWIFFRDTKQPLIVVRNGLEVFPLNPYTTLEIRDGQVLHFWCRGVLANTPARNPVKVVFTSSEKTVALNAQVARDQFEGICILQVESTPELAGLGYAKLTILTPDMESDAGFVWIQ